MIPSCVGDGPVGVVVVDGGIDVVGLDDGIVLDVVSSRQRIAV